MDDEYDIIPGISQTDEVFVDEDLENLDLDWSEYDEPDPGGEDFSGLPTQTEAQEWFNEYGTEADNLVQFTIPDFELSRLWEDEPELISRELMEQELSHDPLDDEAVIEIVADMDSTAEEVPYEWQYWLHGTTEFTDTTPDAPPEPGDVDPVTGEMVQ